MPDPSVLSQVVDCLNQGDFTRAEEVCRELLHNEPENAKAWHLSGISHAQRGRLEMAKECFLNAIQFDGETALYHYNLALAYKGLRQLDEAADSYRAAIARNDKFMEARSNLGSILLEIGDTEEAIRCFRELIERFPENAAARHMLASISGENTPGRCHDDYVRMVFDESFAKTFESQLAGMDYQAPELVGAAFRSIGRDLTKLDVLDAGCGTGLCGPIFRSVARKLVGVDLSEDMLAEARKRNTYDELSAAEITDFMRSHPGSMDLIISADTLCYFGELGEVVEAAFTCLKDDGILIFTVESGGAAAPNQGFELQAHGRYRHSERYVRQMLQDVGCDDFRVSHGVLRTEGGLPVDGLVVTAVRVP